MDRVRSVGELNSVQAVQWDVFNQAWDKKLTTERGVEWPKELTENKQIIMRYIPGEHNPADIFTKPLVGARFDALCKLLLDPQHQGK